MKQTWSLSPDTVDVPLVHTIGVLYEKWYGTGKKLPKRDHFGIHAKIEHMILDIFELAIYTSFAKREKKASLLSHIRTKIEVIKRLARSMYATHILGEKDYIETADYLIQISKMANGWLLYLEKEKEA